MYSKKASVLAKSIVTVLAIPFGLAAQGNGDAQITLLQTTDLHDHANGADHVGVDVDPSTGMGTAGAYARISAYVSYVRASAGHPVILVDSGDWTMGTLYDLTLASRPLALAFFDLMHYNCVTIGNHEWDYTAKGLAQMLGAGQTSFAFHTPIVASNMNAGNSPELVPFVGDGKLIQTTQVEQLSNGLKIGYIGLMGRGAATDASASSAPVTFTDFSTDYGQIQGLVDALRNTAGAQIVVVLSHSGTNANGTAGEDIDLARHVTGINVIASGHTHTPLASARSVTNGKWTTAIIDAGAFGSNVSRIDLTYHAAAGSTTVDASSNSSMTNTSLTTLQAGLVPDPAVISLVGAADQQLNTALGSLFSQTFPDYDRASLGKGIYHPVATAAQNMSSNLLDPVPSPNGLGDLSADSVRSVANGLITQTLAAAGGNPATVPGFDVTPFQAAIVATGVIRGNLNTGVPISFADIYNVLPLGISPDSSQTLPVGFPLISAYLELADIKKLCALQLAVQSSLARSDYYLNLSGLKYTLKSQESYVYFKFATAATVLQVAGQQAAAGSAAALRALAAVSSLGRDSGAALLAAYGNDNPYAGALVELNDVNPSSAQIMANLGALGQVAAAAAADSVAGTSTLPALVVSKAVAAIDVVSGFSPSDVVNTGPTSDLPTTTRVRIAADLYAILSLGVVQTQFGVAVTAYKSASGSASLSSTDFAGILANRISSAPPSAAIQELKEWMALLSYVGTGLKGSVPSDYGSGSDFTQFSSSGAAVKTRSASYPLADIARLTSTLAGLQGSPLCTAGAPPVIAAITNESYGDRLSVSGTIILWGSGFSASGGNALVFTNSGSSSPITIDAASGSYFWDLSPNQINATIAGRLTAGQWTLSVRNACGATSAGSAVTIQ